jgi:hypothetical protein
MFNNKPLTEKAMRLLKVTLTICSKVTGLYMGSLQVYLPENKVDAFIWDARRDFHVKEYSVAIPVLDDQETNEMTELITRLGELMVIKNREALSEMQG